jgi:hypothetical protein
MAGASAVTLQMDHLPNLRALSELLNREEDAIGRLEGVQDRFEAVVASGEHVEVLTDAIRELAREPLSLPASIGRGVLVLFRNENFSLYAQRIKFVERAERVLTTTPASAFLAVGNDGAHMDIDRYCLPPGTDLSIFDPTARLTKECHYELRRGSPSFGYDQGEVIDMSPVGDVLLVKLVENRAVPYQWIVDANTLEPQFVSATLPSLTRYETLIDLTLALEGGQIDAADAVSFFRFLLDHPLHFIRWKAVQGLGKLDKDAAAVALEHLCEDPHPHVQNAARKALTRLAA